MNERTRKKHTLYHALTISLYAKKFKALSSFSRQKDEYAILKC